MIYKETFANGVIVKFERGYDTMPTSFNEFVDMVADAMPGHISTGGPCVGGNSYAYYQLAGIVGEQRIVGVYNVDYDDFRRFTEGKYVVLPLVREATYDDVNTTEFLEGVA